MYCVRKLEIENPKSLEIGKKTDFLSKHQKRAPKAKRVISRNPVVRAPKALSGLKRRKQNNTIKAEFCTNIILKIEVITD